MKAKKKQLLKNFQPLRLKDKESIRHLNQDQKEKQIHSYWIGYLFFGQNFYILLIGLHFFATYDDYIAPIISVINIIFMVMIWKFLRRIFAPKQRIIWTITVLFFLLSWIYWIFYASIHLSSIKNFFNLT